MSTPRSHYNYFNLRVQDGFLHENHRKSYETTKDHFIHEETNPLNSICTIDSDILIKSYIPFYAGQLIVRPNTICTAYPKGWSRSECRFSNLDSAFEALWEAYAEDKPEAFEIIAITYLPNKMGGVYEFRTGKYGYGIAADDSNQSERLLKENEDACTIYFNRDKLDEAVWDCEYAVDAEAEFEEYVEECIEKGEGIHQYEEEAYPLDGDWPAIIIQRWFRKVMQK